MHVFKLNLECFHLFSSQRNTVESNQSAGNTNCILSKTSKKVLLALGAGLSCVMFGKLGTFNNSECSSITQDSLCIGSHLAMVAAAIAALSFTLAYVYNIDGQKALPEKPISDSTSKA